MALGIYIANLLFGNHSLQVLENLRHEKTMLTKEIEVLKNKNAKLHKKYLEWMDAQ
jgi:cell division protein FtsB